MLWVDINRGEVHATNAKTRKDKIIYKGEKISCIVQVSNDKYIISDANKLIKFNRLTEKSSEFLDIDLKHQMFVLMMVR